MRAVRVRALDEGADAGEVKGLVAQHGADGHAARQVRTLLDPLDEMPDVRALGAARHEGAGVEPGGVERLPELGGERAAYGTRVLAGGAQAVDDASGVVSVEAQELEHRLRYDGLVMLAIRRFDVQRNHGGAQRLGETVAGLGQERHAVMRIHEAREALRPLDVARHPVQMIGGAAQHAPSSTQVSLVPPPCEEFTTSDPSRSATRVRPPGTMVTSRPDSTNGRRSM